jgi:hypothetical protein
MMASGNVAIVRMRASPFSVKLSPVPSADAAVA